MPYEWKPRPVKEPRPQVLPVQVPGCSLPCPLCMANGCCEKQRKAAQP